MPKAGTVTFDIEPLAVIQALTWLIGHNPYRKETMGIMIAALTPEQRAERETAFLKQGNDAADVLLAWLRRRKRIATPLQKQALCLDRPMADWLAKFDRPRLGVFGDARSSSMTLPAEYFFLRCRVAVTRKMGRPRITPDQAAKRLAADEVAMSDRSFYRMLKRESENLRPNALAALMQKAATRKTP